MKIKMMLKLIFNKDDEDNDDDDDDDENDGSADADGNDNKCKKELLKIVLTMFQCLAVFFPLATFFS